MTDNQLAPQQPASILATVATKYGLAAKNLYDTLADTIFPSKKSATPEQVQSLLIVANQYDLGQEVGLTGTPAIILDDGTLISGYLPPDQLKARLDVLAAQPAE